MRRAVPAAGRCGAAGGSTAATSGTAAAACRAEQHGAAQVPRMGSDRASSLFGACAARKQHHLPEASAAVHRALQHGAAQGKQMKGHSLHSLIATAPITHQVNQNLCSGSAAAAPAWRCSRRWLRGTRRAWRCSSQALPGRAQQQGVLICQSTCALTSRREGLASGTCLCADLVVNHLMRFEPCKLGQ